MTPSRVGYDERYFPSPHIFNPARWLTAHNQPSQLSAMNRVFMPFAQGTRGCLGMQ